MWTHTTHRLRRASRRKIVERRTVPSTCINEMRGDTEMHMWISVWEVENRFFQNAPPRFKVHVYC